MLYHASPLPPPPSQSSRRPLISPLPEEVRGPLVSLTPSRPGPRKLRGFIPQEDLSLSLFSLRLLVVKVRKIVCDREQSCTGERVCCDIGRVGRLHF